MKLTEKKRKIAVVLVYRTGWDCDEIAPTYIKKLINDIRKNTVTNCPEFFLLTNAEFEEEIPATILEFKTELTYWHSKFEIFREDLFQDFDQVFYFDLDIMITGNLDGIFSSETEFAMLKDPISKGCNSSIISFKPNKQFILDRALELMPDRTKGDQELIEKFVREAGIVIDIWQDYFDIQSYKVEFIKNIHKIPGQIVYFHGQPRPHEILWDLTFRKNDKQFVRQQKLAEALAKRSIVKNKVNKGYIRPEQIFADQTVYIIGGGPSIKNIDFNEYLMDEQVLAINDAYLFKCAKVLFFGDANWWIKNHEDVENIFNGEIWTVSCINNERVNKVRAIGSGLPQRNSIIGWNGNSGMAGISLALNMGAKKIVLFGFDMQFGPNGESNWHPNINKVSTNAYKTFLTHEQKIKKDYDMFWSNIEIINANLNSKLTIFKTEDPIKILENI